MQQKSFSEFYNIMGIVDYPFDLYTAENETAYADGLFVQADNYDSIKNSFEGNRSIIIRGNRGIGKTALLYDLQRKADIKNHLLCMIDDYSMLNMEPKVIDYYELIIRNLTSRLFDHLIEDKKRLKKLGKDDKVFLSMLLSKYTNQTTKVELERKIESVQLSKGKRLIKRNINMVRFILNYGLTAGLNVLNDVVRNYFAVLPPINENEIRNILPSINLDTDTEFEKINASFSLILKLCSVANKMGYKKVTVLMDKFDEDSRMKNNAEIISKFVVSLLTDNKLIENENIQVIISIWEIPFRRLLTEVRTQKHFCPLLSWSTQTLEAALNKRLFVFSKGKIDNYRKLLDNRIDENKVKDIFELSNRNPRDLWHIFNCIFLKQHEIDSCSEVITDSAVEMGMIKFVKEFNFYEYYPRNPKAKANTMDVYSYIKHLLKLSSIEFTKNQLNIQANIGSSTSNYVVGMEAIGLVVNTGEKNNGGVIYKINDPKIIYAIKNKIEISK